jgi:hypothetical protein
MVDNQLLYVTLSAKTLNQELFIEDSYKINLVYSPLKMVQSPIPSTRFQNYKTCYTIFQVVIQLCG